MNPASTTPFVSELWIYPVKSLRGISLQQARLTSQGLEHDRRWMVVRDHGRFVTQRDLSTLALIATHLEAEGVSLSRNGYGSVLLPFAESAGARINSMVWNDAVETTDLGDEIARWLSAATESRFPLRIVRMAEGFGRQHHKPERFGRENATQFADASPYLVASQDSLDALNAELVARGHAPVPMNRFRANIVVRGLPAFSERGIEVLANDRYALGLRDACERCVVPTIDQDTAVRDPAKEPFKTLTDINPMPHAKAPAFAENSVLLRGTGEVIRVGDVLKARG
jgi:uncharacterized protein YcbX